MGTLFFPKLKNKNLLPGAFCLSFIIALLSGPGLSIAKIYISYVLILGLVVYLFISRHKEYLFEASRAIYIFGFYLALQIYIFSSFFRGLDLYNVLRHDLLITASILSLVCAQIFVKRFYSVRTVACSLRIFIWSLVILGLTQSLFQKPTLFYGNPNNLALILLATICITATFERCNLILILVQIALVIQTGSRLAIFLLIPLFLLLGWTRQRIRFYWIIFGALGFLAFLHLLLSLEIDMNSRWGLIQYFLYAIENNEVYSIRGDSIGVRLDLLRQSLSYFYSNPWFGVGPGELSNLISSIHDNGGAPILITNLHNPPVELLVDYGVLGLLIWIFGAYHLFKIFFYCDDMIYMRAGISLLFLILFGSLMISSIYYFVPIWAAVGVTAGLASRNERLHT